MASVDSVGTRSALALTAGIGSILTAACTAVAASGEFTPLDSRRVSILRKVDAELPVADEDGDLPTPNLRLSGESREEAYQQKILAILGLIDAGAAPASRLAEANLLLRFALHRWPVARPAELRGQYAKVWNHHSRNLALRVHCLYSPRFDSDLRAEYRRRLDWLCAPALRRSSENIRFTNNSAYFLAHEATAATERDSFADVRQWLIENLRAFGLRGPHEWGRNYLAWTVGAILNLAEFARDDTVRRLALVALDHYLAQVSGFVVAGNYGSSAVRMWKWTFAQVLPQTAMVRALFPESFPELDTGLRAEWAVTNYRPPRIVSELYRELPAGEAVITTGPERWRHHVTRGGRFLIAAHQAPGPHRFRLSTGGTHGVLGVFVQSAGSPGNCVFPFGCRPMQPPAKQRNLTERYFGYDNVGFAQQGGVVRAVWAGGARFPDVPIRLFHSFGFESRIDDGWAFLTDGEVYIGWRPTVGVPVPDPEAAERTTAPAWGGKWLRSTHTPGEAGEVSVLEAGDAESFGSFPEFCRDVLARNPAAVWDGTAVSYTCRDGAVVRFGASEVTVNGTAAPCDDYPRARMYGLLDYTVSAGGHAVCFDFETGTVPGEMPRAEARLRYGDGAAPGE